MLNWLGILRRRPIKRLPNKLTKLLFIDLFLYEHRSLSYKRCPCIGHVKRAVWHERKYLEAGACRLLVILHGQHAVWRQRKYLEPGVCLLLVVFLGAYALWRQREYFAHSSK